MATDRLALRDRLRRAPALISTFSIVPATEVVEAMALAGLDAVILDMEHGPYSIEAISRLVPVARSRGLHAIARVRTNDPALIGSVLDAGADGVLVPQVSSYEAARAAVAAARFAPAGTRGANPWVRAADFSPRAEWYAEANAAIAVLVMIEGAEGIRCVSEILAIPELDGVFLGPVDLSHSLGVPGETEHPRVIAQVEQVIARAKQLGKATAVFAPTPAVARRWLAMDVSLVAVGVDTGHILSSFRALVTATR
jgi:4-hydroxy-2-oxoheptanedioate aldolase